jgi:hypothetical protein
MSIEHDISRGARAEQLLNDPLLQEAFTSVRNGIVETWEAAPLRDTQGAHELKLMLKLLGDLRTVLEMTVADGKMAAVKLKELNSRVISPAQWSGNTR